MGVWGLVSPHPLTVSSSYRTLLGWGLPQKPFPKETPRGRIWGFCEREPTASNHFTQSCHFLEPEAECCGPFPVPDSQAGRHPERAGATVFFPFHSSQRKCDCV